jgi:hypothetical protein
MLMEMRSLIDKLAARVEALEKAAVVAAATSTVAPVETA